MRLVAVVLLCAGLAAQDAPTSRASMSSDWVKVEFQARLRARALEIMTAALPARARVLERLGIDVGAQLTILVVGDVDEMRAEVVARTGREPPDWAGGLALPALSLVLIRADLTGEPFDRVDSVVTHELVHVAVARASGPEGRRVPRWFEEGLAQWVAGRARPLDVPDLRPAATFGYLLDLSEMDVAFAHGEGAAARAYAQAESFVRFIARRSGSAAIRRVVDLVVNGSDLGAALFMATAADLPTSWGAWQRDLASDRSWMLATGSQAFIAALILVVVILGVRRVLTRKRRIEATWEDETDASSG